ncbi:hypothetical protein TEQG_02353 [Trichophyton equinum CBS 127.97]|uniref:Uncharacterized protein n=1 Tax=Trichophyton equinum (strain ATCC MYA-4606 / CBS 127.97) TaxID=559882 RepID=F2PN51_TRIEC|nr:hypothetical protein TEQG_02353 [Trichophyton equinum CBS 127.97]
MEPGYSISCKRSAEGTSKALPHPLDVSIAGPWEIGLGRPERCLLACWEDQTRLAGGTCVSGFSGPNHYEIVRCCSISVLVAYSALFILIIEGMEGGQDQRIRLKAAAPSLANEPYQRRRRISTQQRMGFPGSPGAGGGCDPRIHVQSHRPAGLTSISNPSFLLYSIDTGGGEAGDRARLALCLSASSIATVSAVCLSVCRPPACLLSSVNK